MIGVKLQGGLGNQMFQYASARGISKNNDKVFVDPAFFKKNKTSTNSFTARKYELNIFKHAKANLANRFWHNVFCNKDLPFMVARKILLPRFRYIQQYGYGYVDNLKNQNGSLYLDGYFQSEKYFSEKRNELLKEFSFPELDEKNLSQLKIIQAQTNSVSIHVRRGDYLKPDIVQHHGILPLTYYTKAIDKLNNSFDDLHFFVFSDDIEWCADNFSFLGNRLTLIQGINTDAAWKDMCLMTHCKHHIIANSSFSWWGAWLSQKQGLKFAPFKWFNPDSVVFSINDFVPSTWDVVYYD